MKTYGTEKSLTIYVKAGSAGPVLQEAGDEVRVLMRSQAARRAGRSRTRSSWTSTIRWWDSSR